MRLKIVLLIAALILFTAGICTGARFNYTWKNKDGVLNVTDYPPPEGTEIIEISIIPTIPEQKKAAPAADIKAQKKMQGPNEEQRRLMAEAYALRNEELLLRQEASRLLEEAREQRRLGKLQRYKERYRRRASKKEKEAQELISQADSLARKAENLEKGL